MRKDKGGFMSNKDKIQSRIEQAIRSKMSKLFKITLTNIEREAKNFHIDPRFFANNAQKDTGFALIRKSLLDDGNDILKFLEIVLDETYVCGKDARVKIKSKDDSDQSQD